MTDSDRATPPEVLDSKRDATRYQVLVEIAARQPAVSQTEIAEAIGVTSQAVSDYVRDLVEHEYVEKEGRGRYTVTKEGVDWLISRTDSLEAYLNRVSSDVLGSVDVDAAIAMDDIAEGSDVGLLMRNGVLHANPAGGTATAVTVTAAAAGEAVGVADFEGVVDYETGYVTVLPVPAVTDAASVAPTCSQRPARPRACSPSPVPKRTRSPRGRTHTRISGSERSTPSPKPQCAA